MRNLLFLAEFLLLALVLWAVLKQKKEKQESKPILTLNEVEELITKLNETIGNVEQSTEKSIQVKEKELNQLRSELIKALQLQNKLEGLK